MFLRKNRLLYEKEQNIILFFNNLFCQYKSKEESMKKKILAAAVLIFLMTLNVNVFAGSKAEASKTSGGGYKVAWSTIYLTPSWMQQTRAMIEARVNKYKAEGIISDFYIANANGDTSQQIAQIENLIAQKYDALVLIAGSSTALNTVVEKAHDAGMVIVNIDSLVTTDAVSSKINTSSVGYGEVCAQWAVDRIGGRGNVIVFNGPAGVAVSDERKTGAHNVLAKYPNIKVVAELYSEYNEGPAMDVIMPALDAYKDVDAIIALGGSQASASLKALQSKNMKLIPITGENYNAFLKEWAGLQSRGFSSFCVGQPNWLGTLAVEQCIRALQGQRVNPNVIVPLPVINDDNLNEYVPNSFADDGFPVKDITEEDINNFLKY
jgi:ribose transport system substrate-binding protein